MKKAAILTILLITLLLMTSCTASGNNDRSEDSPDLSVDYGPVEVYAVLAEKDYYNDVDMTNLVVDYIDIKRLRGVLENFGWPAEQIHELKEFDQESLQNELDWLEENADGNDLVFFYVTGHGNYLRYKVHWNDFFPDEWAQIASAKRVLVVDSCSAAEFTNTINDDPGPHLSLAAVDDDEYGWKGIEEEGLPIVGGIFTFYFAEALSDLKSDQNGDGSVSVQEAAQVAEEKQRSYMHNIVFAVPEFVESYHALGVKPEKDKTFPDVIVDDNIGGELFLEISNK